MIETFVLAIIPFASTNLDDFVLLTILFAGSYRRGNIIFGQILGIAVLTGISLALAIFIKYGGQYYHLHPGAIGILGFVPVWLAVKMLQDSEDGNKTLPEKHGFAQIRAVASLTIAGGGDNLGIYTSIFAASSTEQIITMSVSFIFFTFVWCALADYAVRAGKKLVNLEERLARIFPWVLIGLGVYVLLKSKTPQFVIEVVIPWVTNTLIPWITNLI